MRKLAWVCMAAVWMATCQQTWADDPRLGQQAADFTLRDFRGQEHALHDLADRPLVVLAFLGTDCPLARLYGPRLQALSDELAPQGVAFLGINSNRQDTPTEMAAYARLYGIGFPLLKDPGNVVADALSAVRTPEVFVLDAERKVRYWGRIDDQYLPGVQRGAPEHRDLALALADLLAGREVSVPSAPAVGCHIGRVSRIEPHGEITYANQISRLFQRRCMECHRTGEVAPFPLTTYEETVGWGETIVEVTRQRRMPPWFANPEHGHFSNDSALTAEELQLIEDWVAAGSPEGDPLALPPPREFVTGWRIGQPDQVVFMQEAPFEVPAEGAVKYQYFSVDPGFAEDKWIQAAEARPDNRGVVHHILVYVVPPDAEGDFRLRAGAIGFAPGLPPVTYPEGTALFAPAGSKLVFQMHYTPNGAPQQDRSCVGFIFTEGASVRQRIRGGMAANFTLLIPPGEDSHQVQSQHLFRQDLLLMHLTPHMHLRGKAFRFEAEYPDGRREILLDVPRYDFNWQLRYELIEPKLMPQGTWLRCTAWFDNSPRNLANPDPAVSVRWGDQTWEEMMIGWFTGVRPDENLQAAPGAQPQE